MEQKTIKDLKVGELFTRLPVENPTEAQVWVRGAYDKTDRTYGCYKWNDVNYEVFMKGSRAAYTGFTF